MRINGVDLKAFGNTAVINGAKQARINANSPYGYDKWRMVWNGNHFAPPEPNSVLYFPGIPGSGSTIQDFSFTFSDSGIDTDEALDATETGVDCDADATTAIPAGSIVRIEGEYCRVSATGTTLTVKRDFYNGGAATHNTNQDIYVWLPNNGTITGATWKKTSGGLSYLDYDGINDQTLVTDAASVQNLFDGGGTCIAWIYPETINSVPIIFDAGIRAASKGWALYLANDSGTTVELLLNQMFDGASNGRWESQAKVVNQSQWQMVGVTYNCDDVANNPTLYFNGASVAIDETLTPIGTRVSDVGVNKFIGRSDNADLPFDGGIALPIWSTSVWTSSQMASYFQQTRHLFGV